MTDPITQIKQIIEHESDKIIDQHDDEEFGYIESRGFDKCAELLLPVLIKAIEQRNDWAKQSDGMFSYEQMDQELLNILKEGK